MLSREMDKMHSSQDYVFDINQFTGCYNKLVLNNNRLSLYDNKLIEKLNDNDILMLLQLFHKIHGSSSNNIKIGLIDSQLSKIIMNDYLNNKETNVKTLQTFLNYFSYNYDIITIPLCSNSHWSLVLYIKLYDNLFYIDPFNKYHQNYINKFYEMLIKQNITIKNMINIKTINQEGDWECGYYVIMFFHLSIRLYQQR